jgi:hypothetical protein
MRFLAMHRSSPDDEAGIPPSREFIESMGRLIQEGMQLKVFLGGEGLRASVHRVRLQVAGGERRVVKGPFASSTDPVGGVVLVKVASLAEAVSWAERIAALVPVSEIEVGPVCEPWDLGMGPKPPGDLPIRHLLLLKAPEGSNGPTPRTPEARTRMQALLDEMTRAGALLSSEWLQPSSRSVRLKFAGGKRTTLDGPFAESKELIAGFSILRFESMPEIIEWTDGFGRMFPEVQVDIRPLHESSDLA